MGFFLQLALRLRQDPHGYCTLAQGQPLAMHAPKAAPALPFQAS